MSKIYYKSLEEIELIRESSILVSMTLAEIAKVIEPGITTKSLDKLSSKNNGIQILKNSSSFNNFEKLCLSSHIEFQNIE